MGWIMKKITIILIGIILAFLVFGFADGPKIYQKHQDLAWLGISTKELTPQLREYFGVEEDMGVLISEVAEDSPAEASGLKAGDVIIEADGDAIYSKKDLAEIIRDFNPGDEIEIEFVRNQEEESINVELGEARNNKFRYFGYRPSRFEVIVPEMNIDIPEIEFEMSEVDREELEDLQIQIKEEMKYHKEELKEHMEDLREQMNEMKIEIRDEFRETI
jgi:membrane-associated protease RseP (regulator of RpoE activity)